MEGARVVPSLIRNPLTARSLSAGDKRSFSRWVSQTSFSPLHHTNSHCIENTFSSTQELWPSCPPPAQMETPGPLARNGTPKRKARVAARIEKMPVDIKRMIVLESGSVRDAMNLSKTCTKFYYLVKNDLGFIVTEILKRTIGEDLLAEAHRCKELRLERKLLDLDDIHYKNIASEWVPIEYFHYIVRLETLDTSPKKFSAPKALGISDFHACIEGLADGCISAFAKWPILPIGDSLRDRPATRSERTRIMRALYRLQTLYTVDRIAGHMCGVSEIESEPFNLPNWTNQSIFCNSFAFSELAQLLAVYRAIHSLIDAGEQ